MLGHKIPSHSSILPLQITVPRVIWALSDHRPGYKGKLTTHRRDHWCPFIRKYIHKSDINHPLLGLPLSKKRVCLTKWWPMICGRKKKKEKQKLLARRRQVGIEESVKLRWQISRVEGEEHIGYDWTVQRVDIGAMDPSALAFFNWLGVQASGNGNRQWS